MFSLQLDPSIDINDYDLVVTLDPAKFDVNNPEDDCSKIRLHSK